MSQIHKTVAMSLPKKTLEKDSAISYSPDINLTLAQIQELDKKYVLPTYARMPVAFTYGSGEFLYDSDGNEYIDFLSGIAVTGLGHAHADLISALNAQADKLWHTSNLFFNQQQAMLARALIEISFPGKVFFCNSGTEANEAAIKYMRAWGLRKSPHKQKIIALKNSFHGRTFGAMSATGQEKIHGGFGDIVPHMHFVNANDIAEISKAIDETTCGVIMEPVQGEGGINPLDAEFLNIARKRCNEEGALLCFDEIQIGLGRSGHYFAFQHYNIQPDMVTLAKGLGGGFPIGAMIVQDKVNDVFGQGQHGSTFGGNHLACAVAYEVLRVMEANNIPANVNRMSTLLHAKLEQIKDKFPSIVKEIRGMGLLIGIVLREDIEARPLVEKALREKLVLGRAGNNILRLAPPLILRESTLDRAVVKIEALISTL